MIVHALVTYLSEGCWCEEVRGLVVGGVDEFFRAAGTDTVLGLHRKQASYNTMKCRHGHNEHPGSETVGLII